MPASTPTPSDGLWNRLAPFLKSSGYRVQSRPRELAIPHDPSVRAALELKTGRYVALKLYDADNQRDQLETIKELSHHSNAENPMNHTVRCERILELPGQSEVLIMVMPLLKSLGNAPFATIEEAIDCLRQVFEGLEFLHGKRIAHLDISLDKIMFADGSKEGSRTYFLTGFGSSRNYGENNFDDAPPGVWDINSSDNTVPEFRPGFSAFYSGPFNPFLVDVYLLGNMIKRDLIEGNPDTKRHGYPELDFLAPLAQWMTDRQPSCRPNMTRARCYLGQILSGNAGQ
ncbi:hypothetical protein FA13DRAFT_1775668 [Coprinellus micaceus]|uniref:Protein kinase domain-containing protein n=1 Tax=Coprinellus micaceus TaxID=71717 RepID=A0A4Y7T606_COPMI|nr:hypothetical protein FA13DRAFT_1775668 [Coprinellus micaceus]